MPNWCSNETICFSTDKSDVEKLIKKITKGIQENPIPNGFGPNWLGNLAYIIGLDYNKIYCRGELLEDSYEIEKKVLFIMFTYLLKLHGVPMMIIGKKYYMPSMKKRIRILNPFLFRSSQDVNYL